MGKRSYVEIKVQNCKVVVFVLFLPLEFSRQPSFLISNFVDGTVALLDITPSLEIWVCKSLKIELKSKGFIENTH